MMFDPPDYPYKELSERYDSLLYNNAISGLRDSTASHNKNLDVTAMITNVDNQLSFHSNDSGKYFSVENALMQSTDDSIETHTELCVKQTENMFNYEPTLLDENTVNQFLLPFQGSADDNKFQDMEKNGPDILALHSCVICHEIFTTESDLLDHTILLHASCNADLAETDLLHDVHSNQIENVQPEETNNNDVNFETEWLVCRMCERVLSTALEVEPNVQLCCLDSNGKGSVLTRKMSTMFVCDICNGLFANGESLDKHRGICYVGESINYDLEETVTRLDLEETTEHNADPSSQYPEVCFSCDVCEKQYSSTEELKVHSVDCQRLIPGNIRRPYTSRGNSKMWNCGSCNQLFATARELYRHKRGEDRPVGAPLTAYVCEECDKVLGSMCALHTHKKMHKVSKPGYPCRVCGRRFNQSGHLAIHMRMHTGERPYPCDLCTKAFKVKVERDDHRRTHTGERPFACNACPKTFTAAARLREHARIHTDQRPYRCEICGAAFRRPYARTVHTLIHTGEKPHECDVCGTAFRRSGDMWKHKRTLHGLQAGNIDADLNKL